jgi:hypothetical protein
VEEIDVPFGLGSRHLAAASVSQRLGVVAIVVSESAIVRVFHGGELIAEIIPELWLFRRHLQPLLPGPVTEQYAEHLTIFTPEDRDGATNDGVDKALAESSPAKDAPPSPPIAGLPADR